MDYHEAFLADIVESVLASCRRPLHATAREIPDGGFEVVIHGEVADDTRFGMYTFGQALTIATGYDDITIEHDGLTTVLVMD